MPRRQAVKEDPVAQQPPQTEFPLVICHAFHSKHRVKFGCSLWERRTCLQTNFHECREFFAGVVMLAQCMTPFERFASLLLREQTRGKSL
jgi:hypothetical protein